MNELLKVAVAVVALAGSTALVAGTGSDQSSQDLDALGFVEWIVLDNPSLRLKARLDTGANTSSLHATEVEEFEKDGDDWVRFELPLDHHKESDDDAVEDTTLIFERPIERTILVKRKGAESQRRHVVEMDFCIDGKKHDAEFSLTDRSRFTYPALLGRRFMGGEILVNPDDSFLAQSECDYSPLEELAEAVEDEVV